MYTQFFGNYLVHKGYISLAQLFEAIKVQSASHIKLGFLAIDAGFLDAAQVERIHEYQTKDDKLFGELAVLHGYLKQEQVDVLLNTQKPSYLFLSQAIIDQGYMTFTSFEDALASYQRENDLNDYDFTKMQNERVDQLIQKFCHFDNPKDRDLFVPHITLLFRNIVRFIGDDFIPQSPLCLTEYETAHYFKQHITEPFGIETGIDVNVDALVTFVSRYVKDTLIKYDEFAMDCIQDFLNLHNGLFTVNISNQNGIELDLDPPQHVENVTLTAAVIYSFPIVFQFGTVTFLLKKM